MERFDPSPLHVSYWSHLSALLCAPATLFVVLLNVFCVHLVREPYRILVSPLDSLPRFRFGLWRERGKRHPQQKNCHQLLEPLYQSVQPAYQNATLHSTPPFPKHQNTPH